MDTITLILALAFSLTDELFYDLPKLRRWIRARKQQHL